MSIVWSFTNIILLKTRRLIENLLTHPFKCSGKLIKLIELSLVQLYLISKQQQQQKEQKHSKARILDVLTYILVNLEIKIRYPGQVFFLGREPQTYYHHLEPTIRAVGVFSLKMYTSPALEFVDIAKLDHKFLHK